MQLLKHIPYVLVLTLCLGAFVCVSAQGSGNQMVEEEKGETDVAYPVSIEQPRDAKECAKDEKDEKKDKKYPDVVLVFNTPSRGKGSPNDIRWWSKVATVRVALGSLAASGLTSPTTRVCVGYRGSYIGRDYQYIYLWRKSQPRALPRTR